MGIHRIRYHVACGASNITHVSTRHVATCVSNVGCIMHPLSSVYMRLPAADPCQVMRSELGIPSREMVRLQRQRAPSNATCRVTWLRTLRPTGGILANTCFCTPELRLRHHPSNCNLRHATFDGVGGYVSAPHRSCDYLCCCMLLSDTSVAIRGVLVCAVRQAHAVVVVCLSRRRTRTSDPLCTGAYRDTHVCHVIACSGH